MPTIEDIRGHINVKPNWTSRECEWIVASDNVDGDGVHWQNNGQARTDHGESVGIGQTFTDDDGPLQEKSTQDAERPVTKLKSQSLEQRHQKEEKRC